MGRLKKSDVQYVNKNYSLTKEIEEAVRIEAEKNERSESAQARVILNAWVQGNASE